jgi:hypothetical protein
MNRRDFSSSAFLFTRRRMLGYDGVSNLTAMRARGGGSEIKNVRRADYRCSVSQFSA